MNGISRGWPELSVAVLLMALEVALAVFRGSAAGPAAALVAYGGLALCGAWPLLGSAVSLGGLTIMAAHPPEATATGTLLLLAVGAAPAARGAWRRLALMLPASLGCAIWLSRGAPGPAEWLITSLLWLLLYGGTVAGATGLWASLRRREARLARRWDEQRRTIAQELHDSVAHELSLIALTSQVPVPDVDAARASLHSIAEGARRANSSLRGLMGVLRLDGELRHLALDVVLALAREELPKAGLEPLIQIEGDIDRLPDNIGDTLARITRECVNNMVRHAIPTLPCTMLIHVGDRQVDAACINACRGHRGKGFGLAGMVERAEAAGGDCHIDATGGVWSVRVTIPYVPASTSST